MRGMHKTIHEKEGTCYQMLVESRELSLKLTVHVIDVYEQQTEEQ
jgi:hypothetical protein